MHYHICNLLFIIYVLFQYYLYVDSPSSPSSPRLSLHLEDLHLQELKAKLFLFVRFR